ncbi:hypothetical protein V5K00_RS23000 [Enterobacter asburiae]
MVVLRGLVLLCKQYQRLLCVIFAREQTNLTPAFHLSTDGAQGRRQRQKLAQQQGTRTLLGYPETLFAGSYDDQQQVLRLSSGQSSWHTLVDIAAGIWLTDASRSDVFSHPAAAVPAGGITL